MCFHKQLQMACDNVNIIYSFNGFFPSTLSLGKIWFMNLCYPCHLFWTQTVHNWLQSTGMCIDTMWYNHKVACWIAACANEFQDFRAILNETCLYLPVFTHVKKKKKYIYISLSPGRILHFNTTTNMFFLSSFLPVLPIRKTLSGGGNKKALSGKTF